MMVKNIVGEDNAGENWAMLLEYGTPTQRNNRFAKYDCPDILHKKFSRSAEVHLFQKMDNLKK